MTVYNLFYLLIAGIKLKCVVHSKILMFYSTVFLDLMKLKLSQYSILFIFMIKTKYNVDDKNKFDLFERFF